MLSFSASSSGTEDQETSWDSRSPLPRPEARGDQQVLRDGSDCTRGGFDLRPQGYSDAAEVCPRGYEVGSAEARRMSSTCAT